MALRLRRGTDAERLIITPLEGELIYTTDTKKLYVGDGVTVGGIAVDTASGGGGGGLADLSSSSINDLADVNADSAVPSDGDVLTFDAASGDWRAEAPTGGGTNIVAGDSFNINILADDSSLLVDASTSTVNGTLKGVSYGEHVGSVYSDDSTTILVDAISGVHNGTFEGNLLGSVYSSGSTLLIDGDNGGVVVADVNNDITSSNFLNSRDIRIGNSVVDNIITTIDPSTSSLIITTANTSGTVVLSRSTQIGGTAASVPDGRLTIFTENDGFIPDLLLLAAHDTANSPAKMSIGRARNTKGAPAAVTTNDELGNYLLAGFNGANYVPGGGIKATVTDTPDIARIPAKLELFTMDGSGGEEVVITMQADTLTTEFSGAAKLVNYADTSARDSAITSPEAGMMVFIIGTSKAQVYDGSAWVDLH